MRGQRQRVGIDHRIHHHRTASVRERRGQPFSHISWIFDADARGAHSFGDFGEIRVLEIDAERDYARFLLLDIDKIERLIVEDDVNHGRLPLDLRQQIAEVEHREPSVAAQCDGLAAGVR